MIENKELQGYIKKIKGNRTFKEFAEDTGISVGTLVKYVNGKGKGDLRAETLKNLINNDRNPQFSVNLPELYTVAGLVDNCIVLDADMHFQLHERENKGREYALRNMIEGELAKAIIKDNKFVFLDDNLTTFDKAIGINNEDIQIKKWYIEYYIFEKREYSGENVERHDRDYARIPRLFLGRRVLRKPNAEEKISVITNDEELYKSFESKKGEIAFKGDLSVILFDEENCVIKNEVYLSTYDENSVEFFLFDIDSVKK